MSLDAAMRLTEILLGLALIQQSLEHLLYRGRGRPGERPLFGTRLILCLLLIAGVNAAWILPALAALSLWILHRFQGPYNGGSDRMGLLSLWCLTIATLMPTTAWRELFFAYLAAQLTLSYFVSGWVKVINPDWRSGRALRDVFLFSTYPVSESLRGWAHRPGTMRTMGWAVMIFELVFPLTLFWTPALIAALVIAGGFHLANACLFGLNRFFWTWLSVYPSIIWLQQRLS